MTPLNPAIFLIFKFKRIVLHFKISRIFLGLEGTDAIRIIDGNDKQKQKLEKKNNIFLLRKEGETRDDTATLSPDLSPSLLMTLKT